MGADQSCKFVLVRWAVKVATFVSARKAEIFIKVRIAKDIFGAIMLRQKYFDISFKTSLLFFFSYK